MALTETFSGSHAVNPDFRMTHSGDLGGADQFADPVTVQWAAAGGTAPTGSHCFEGSMSITGAQTILLAHATDPLQATGAAVLSREWAPSGAAKLKFLWIRITSGAKLTIARAAANGLPIFSAASDGMQFGKQFLWYDDDGSITGTVTTGTNDAIVLTPSTGTVEAQIVCVFGP